MRTVESMSRKHCQKVLMLEATFFLLRVPIHVTGAIKIGNAEIAVLDSDHGSVETQKKLNLPGDNDVALSANHLQKLRLSFDLTTPSGHALKPHQAFLKLRHESGVEHIFLEGNSRKKFEIILDFLGLVEKFFYLSGKYGIQLTVGDSDMENSFLQPLGHVELDLPDAPEKAAPPPPQPVDPLSRCAYLTYAGLQKRDSLRSCLLLSWALYSYHFLVSWLGSFTIVLTSRIS